MRIRDYFHFLRPRRFYLQIYIALLCALVVGVSMYYGSFYLFAQSRSEAQQSAFDTFAQLASKALPASDAPYESQTKAIKELRASMGTQFAFYASDGTLITSTKSDLPAPDPMQTRSGWMKTNTSVFALKLNDGRWLLGQERSTSQTLQWQALIILLLSLTTALGTYPVVRRLTKRLEKLRNSVEALGSGQLQARVAVEGRDEIADLANSFNRAANRIEELIAAQKKLLANVSHELRSPLARVRMAIELLVEQHGDAQSKLRDEIAKNITEIDHLIDEILLASRLDANPNEQLQNAEFPLHELFEEETKRLNIQANTQIVSLYGDQRLLRRVIRNLLENALRYGKDPEAQLRVLANENSCEITIVDQGPGIPEDERDKIFLPFYRVRGSRERDGGVGLGLAIVKQIVELHSGTVHCESGRNGGSQFVIRLPLRGRPSIA